jgi:hypothetical protein
MEQLSNRGLRSFLLAYLACYVVCGSIGALIVADFYDLYRGYFYAFFAIPVATLFFYVTIQYPQVAKVAPKLFCLWCLSLILSFGWGNLLLLNAISGASPTVVNVAIRNDTYHFNYRAGGLGWLYRLRF